VCVCERVDEGIVREKLKEVESRSAKREKKSFLHLRWATFGGEIEIFEMGRGCDFLSLV